MKNQIIQKRVTMNYLFVFIGLIFLLFYSDPCAAQEKTNSESYKTLIKQADKAFAAQDYANAMELYKKANQAKPEYTYPVDKIHEIKKILASDKDPKNQPSTPPKSTNASYKDLLAKADYEYNNDNLATALLYYQKAYQTKPEYNYAPGKIEEINLKLNASPETKAGIYENTIHAAENFYAQKNYQQAKTEYEKASLIDTAAQLPKDRLNQISSVYVDPDDMGNFNLAIANGDKALASSDFDHAILFYEAALAIHPNAKFVSKKKADAKSQQLAYKANAEKSAPAVVTADKIVPTAAAAKTINQKEIPAVEKTGESQLQSEQKKYDAALAGAENSLKSADYENALVGFKSASAIKPAENYPKNKITEIEKLLAEKATAKESEKNYATAIASADQLLSASKYTEALNAYQQALSIKPNEAYPIAKIAEINSLLSKQKSDSDNYAQAIRSGDKALATGNYNLALTSFQDAQKIKPSETYPVEQIAEIKAQIAAQQKKDEKYAIALKTGDQLFSEKEYSGALASYTEASELKKNEKYPQDQIARINKINTDSKSVGDNYNSAIAEGDKLFGMKDYSGAISSFNKANSIKPAEIYPVQRISEINKIIEETKLARSAEYNNALEAADKLYNTKVYDKAIEAYEAAAKLNPGDSYPDLQINKIRKYMSDHAILDLFSQTLTISKGTEKKFNFSAIDPSLRKNDYILLKARSTSNIAPKVYLNYGKDNSKNGGIVLRSLDKETISDFLISISIQDKWFREDNNWISIAVETGEIEITKVQIAAGE